MLAMCIASCIELSVLVGVSHSNNYILFSFVRSVNSILIVYTFREGFGALRGYLKLVEECRDLPLCRNYVNVL